MKKGIVRGIAVIIAATCFCMVNGITSYAQETSGTKNTDVQEPKDIFKFTIPAEWGRIKEIYKGSKGAQKVIIHIQDAHCNYEAQNNIANILERLVDDYGVGAAGIEGSSGRLDMEMFSAFPDEDIRAQAAEYFVRQGKLSGPEALVVKQGFEYPLELYGIEDPALYADNFNAYKTSLPFQNEAKIFFVSLKNQLTALKSYLYNKDLLAFDVQQTAFINKSLSLNEYTDLLEQEMKKHKISIANYENLSKLLKVNNAEGGIDFIKAEEERTKLLTELTNILSEEDIKTLLDEGLSYKNGYTSAAKYLSFVRKLAKNNKVNLDEYKNLDAYIDYAENYDKINSAALFDEMWQIEDAVKEKLYTNKEQKQLDILVRGLEAMQRLVDIKMVNRDLLFYREHGDNLKTDSYYDFIKTQSEKVNLTTNLPTELGYLDVYIPAWVNFYEVAGKRDQAMIDNTLKIMRDKKSNIVVMVTGGFHTRELTRILASQNISYLVITPRITDNEGNRYFDILKGKKTALDSLTEQMNR
ncbi:MAG: hypothetical protein ABII88_00180 [Candidatus Omnitrophota bacterium]